MPFDFEEERLKKESKGWNTKRGKSGSGSGIPLEKMQGKNPKPTGAKGTLPKHEELNETPSQKTNVCPHCGLEDDAHEGGCPGIEAL